MENAISSGLIGGVISGIAAVLICPLLIARAGRSVADGELRFGRFMLLLGLLCLPFLLAPLAALLFDPDLRDNASEFAGALFVLLLFGFFSCLSLGEYFRTRGSYDHEGIRFSTLWSGVKQERWETLESVLPNNAACWYVLRFSSGRSIRLSFYLSGLHGRKGLLDILKRRGFRC